MTEYMLVQDDTGLWYVIPAEEEDGWWEQIYPDEPNGYNDIPGYATTVNGSVGHVKFTDFRIKR